MFRLSKRAPGLGCMVSTGKKRVNEWLPARGRNGVHRRGTCSSASIDDVRAPCCRASAWHHAQRLQRHPGRRSPERSRRAGPGPHARSCSDSSAAVARPPGAPPFIRAERPGSASSASSRTRRARWKRQASGGARAEGPAARAPVHAAAVEVGSSGPLPQRAAPACGGVRESGQVREQLQSARRIVERNTPRRSPTGRRTSAENRRKSRRTDAP